MDYMETMTHILSNLYEEYKNTVENIEDGLNDNINPLTIERIRENNLAK